MVGLFARMLVVVAFTACSDTPQGNRYELRFDSLSRLHHAASSWPERGRVMFGAIFDLVWALEYEPSELVTRDDRELDLLFRAAHLAATYSLDERHVQHMRAALDILDRRRRAATRHYASLYRTYVHVRMLADARALALEHGLAEVEELPGIREVEVTPGLPRLWIVDPDRRELEPRGVDLTEGVRLVVISHPRCHFSRAAMLAIAGDPILASTFATHATWLAPQDSVLSFDTIQRWNHDNPTQAIALTIDRSEWTMIDRWHTPTFYVLRDGVVTARVEGWPRAGRRAELVHALQDVGLL